MNYIKRFPLILCLSVSFFPSFAQSVVSIDNPEPDVPAKQTQLLIEHRVNKALPKAIVGTVIFGVGELLGWTIIYPKDKELEDKLFDTYDEETGEEYTYQERAEQLLSESIQLLVLSIPFRAMVIAGVTTSCINATKSTRTSKDVLKTERIQNNVWKPYIAGWVVGMIGSAIATVSGFTETREPLKVSRICGVGQSTLWGVASIMSIIKCSSNKKMVANKKVSVIPSASGKSYSITMNLKF